MKLINIPTFFASVAIYLSFNSCTDSDVSGETKYDASIHRTVLVYMMAENSLGSEVDRENCAYLDSTEIANGAVYMSSNDNLLLFIDDNKNPRIYRYYNSGNGVKIDKVKQYDYNASSTSPAILKETIEFMKNEYASESYGLVMWSHGDGWMPSLNTNYKSRSIGIESNTNQYSDYVDRGIGTEMDIDDMATAISESGVKMDYIFFDACIMQNIEVAYSLKDVTKYVVGSPILTSGLGAYYTSMIKSGFFNYPTTDDNVKNVASTYYSNSTDNAVSLGYGDFGLVISVLKTSELDSLAAVTSRVLQNSIKDSVYPDMGETFRYLKYSSSLGYRPEMFDANASMRHLLSDADYAQWKAQFDRCLVYKAATDKYMLSTANYKVVDKENYCGVSMYIPQSSYYSKYPYGDLNEAFAKTKWYKAAGWDKTGL